MTEKPAQFAVDASMIGTLGLAKLASKEKFCANVPNGKAIYEDILWLDHLISSGEVELILPYNVMKGLKARDPNANTPVHKLEKVRRQETYKRFAKMYMNSQPNIKIAYIDGGFVGDYLILVENVAELYTEEETDFFIPYDERTKPFVYHNDKLSFTALKMAEATLLGLDFLTFNIKYFLKKPVHVQNAIEETNQQHLNSSTKPISLDQALEILDDLSKTEDYIKKIEKQPRLACEFLDYQSFKNKAHEVYLEKKETRALHNTRGLFLKYLDQPINLDNLKPMSTEENFEM